MRSKGTLPFSANFEPKVAGPLDGRIIVGLKADLTEQSTWLNSDGNIYLYDGITVTVNADTTANNGLYRLKSRTGYSNITNWEKIGDFTVIDNTNQLFSGALKLKFAGATITWDETLGAYIVEGFEGPAGVSGIDYLGDYLGTTEYYQRDTIRVTSGNSYYCKVEGPISGIEPEVTPGWQNSWSLFVLRGAPGNPGYTPIKGVDYDDGAPGREVTISKNETAIIWKYVGDAEWQEVVKFSDIMITGGSTTLTTNIPVYGTSFGKWPSGSTIPAIGKTLEQVVREAVFVATAPTATLSVTSGQPEYNSTNITNTLSYSSQPNPSSGGPTIVKYILRFRRAATGDWVELFNVESTEEVPVVIPSSGTYSHENLNVVDKTSSFNYEYEVTDSNNMTTIAIINTTPKNYASPSIGSVTTNTKEMGDLVIIENRNIVKNSVNTTISTWQVYIELDSNGTKYPVGNVISAITSTSPQVSVSNAGEMVINGGAPIRISGASFGNKDIKDATSIKIYVYVTDTVGSLYLPIVNRTLVLYRFFGTKATAITDYRTLSSTSGTSQSWFAGGKHHYILVPSGKSLLTAKATPTQENLLANFQAGQSSVNVLDAGGNSRAYTRYYITTPVNFDNTIETTTT